MGIKNRIKKVLNKILKMNTSSSSTGTPSIVIQEINHPHQQNSQDIINTQSTYPDYTPSEIDNMEDLDRLNDYSNFLNEQYSSLRELINAQADFNERLQQNIDRTRTQINPNYVNFNNQPQQYINRAQTQIQNYANLNNQPQQYINRALTQIQNYANLNNQPQQYINRALTQPSTYVNSFGNGMPIGRAATTSNIPNQSINFNPPNDTNTQSPYHNYTDAEINNMSLDELNELSLSFNASIREYATSNRQLQQNIGRTQTQIQNNQQDINRTQTQIQNNQQDINRTRAQIYQDYLQFVNFINQPQQGMPIEEEAPPSYVSVIDDTYLYQNNERPEQSNILTRSDSSRSVHSNTSIASSTRTENSMAVNTGHNVGSDISTHNQSTASSSDYSIGSTLRGLIADNNYYYDHIDNISLTSDNSRPISTGTSDNLSQTGSATPTLR